MKDIRKELLVCNPCEQEHSSAADASDIFYDVVLSVVSRQDSFTVNSEFMAPI